MNSALRYRVQGPMVDSLLKDIGIDGSNIAKSGIFRDASDMTRATTEINRLNTSKDKDSSSGKSSKGDK